MAWMAKNPPIATPTATAPPTIAIPEMNPVSAKESAVSESARGPTQHREEASSVAGRSVGHSGKSVAAVPCA